MRLLEHACCGLLVALNVTLRLQRYLDAFEFYPHVLFHGCAESLQKHFALGSAAML